MKKLYLLIMVVGLLIVLSGMVFAFVWQNDKKNVVDGDGAINKIFNTPQELFVDFSVAINTNNFDLFKQTIALEAMENYGSSIQSLETLRGEISGYKYDSYQEIKDFWFYGSKGEKIEGEGGYITLKNSATNKTAKLLIMKIDGGYKVVED